MKLSIINKLKKLQTRFKEIEILLSDKNIMSNKAQFRALSKEYVQLNNIVACFERWMLTKKEMYNTEQMLNDPEINQIVQEEIKKIKINQSKLEQELQILLFPTNSDDKRGCFVEIRAGTGGNEAALFAGKLFRMYTRYAETKNWETEIININVSEYGGYKEIITKIPNEGAYGRLKFESGGHRVQRIPHTESQGRIHTSTCTIAVIPEIPVLELPIIDFNELRIDTFRSSGAGGQHVNTTDSAIRITHIPTGIVVECQDERSQHKNKAKALAVLGSRLYNFKVQQRQKKETSTRRLLLGTGDRSDRIRTYNFQQGRVTDHRINLTLYRLNEIIEGNLDILIEPIMQEYKTDQLTLLAK
ncbi:peptide chain release factor 1 [Blochmannia endosymbiont of Camponotus (Colobopsis) obliquus]|uniref:peptide chain release factor 1 n=1 Tax=Blochmannia endosymbiont of Camponotus (Colobopsis) obliquus TaxID=1505597 RepID=UPI00061A5748|nr:peptide chain release factor 1 [Blochmannia endosymbiont of Camponotus (Colobopsis) obliquus]AKC60511.1 peptide chain release factor 1 [Blochmannia endosymbiont of Camponotus (Colobopsis) obliquus]